MTFYQELQLSSVGSKQLIKNTTDKKEKRRHILIYNFKVYLVMAFCVAVVTLFSKIFGADNSVPGVVVLLAVLVLRQADFGVRTSHGLLCIAGIFGILIAGTENYQYDASGSGIFCECGMYSDSHDFRMPQCDHVKPVYVCPWISAFAGV